MLLHLLKKTYIELDLHVEMNLDRVVISETNGYAMLEQLDKVSTGTLFAYSNTVSNLIGADKQFPTFYDFIKFCSDHNDRTDRKLIIYCDKGAISELMSLWFKAIFVDINSSSAYRIISSAFAKKILLTRSATYINALNDEYEMNQISEVEFSSAFDQASVTNSDIAKILSLISDSRSVEYLLASYFYNESLKDKLAPVVKKMINRHVRDAFKEAWNVIQRRILRTSLQEQLGIQTYTIDNVLTMRNDPGLSALVASKVWMDSDRSATGRPSLDLKSLTGPQINQIRKILTDLGDTYANSVSDRINLYITKLLLPVFSDQDLKEVLEFDLTAEEQSTFYSIADKTEINVYFIDHIFEMKKQNLTEHLRPYLLRV